MRGQYGGVVKDAEGKRVGRIATAVDPDRSSGYALFADETGGDLSHHVARLELQSVEGGVEARLSVDRHLESGFQIPEPNKLEDGYEAWATLKPTELGFRGAWQSSVGGSGVVDLESLNGDRGTRPTIAVKRLDEWAEFKGWAASCAPEGEALYRGQSSPHPLRTSFHRTGRVDLFRYTSQDLPAFQDQLVTTTGRSYDLTNNLGDAGAVVGLAQHHGFPTPLLDWTESPYIAAYFAFAGALESNDGAERVRVYRLTPAFMARDRRDPVLQMWDVWLKVQLFRPESRGNVRLLGQQGAFTFSNAVDMERLLSNWQQQDGQVYLEAVDMPRTLARKALADLRFMGTTASALFPGLDGVATHLKHKLFYSH